MLSSLAAAVDAALATHAARTAQGPCEVRALTIYDQVPPDLDAMPVVDDRNAPHLWAGETAVLDLADVEVCHGELYAVRYSRGPAIMQTIRRTLGDRTSWWCVQLDRPDGPAEVAAWAAAGDSIPFSDGPYVAGALEARILGRIVGVVTTAGEVPHG